jgi:oxalate decarboxylase/phosphoglucose isomerase-like protein (cupin superfamily)
MKTLKRLALPFALVLAPFAMAATEGDVMTVAPDHYTVLVDNAHVRVVRNVLAPGEKDGFHTYAAGWFHVDQGGSMKVVQADGTESTWAPATGESGWLNAEGMHTSENIGKAPMSFILVEVKSAAK